MFSNLPDNPYGEGTKVDYSSGENIRGVFYLSDEQIFEDISIDEIDGIRYATVSQSAFTYAEPQICLLYTSPSPRDRTRSRMPSSA